MAKPLGRPPKPKGTTLPETFQIRLTADDKARWAKAAKAAGTSLSEWVRESLNKASGAKPKRD
jgi:predicted HicB family RNase H-like nuclease